MSANWRPLGIYNRCSRAPVREDPAIYWDRAPEAETSGDAAELARVEKAQTKLFDGRIHTLLFNPSSCREVRGKEKLAKIKMILEKSLRPSKLAMYFRVDPTVPSISFHGGPFTDLRCIEFNEETYHHDVAFQPDALPVGAEGLEDPPARLDDHDQDAMRAGAPKRDHKGVVQQRGTKSGGPPDRPESGPRGGPRTENSSLPPQEASKTPQDAPKSPKRPPKGTQEAPRDPQEAPRAPQ